MTIDQMAQPGVENEVPCAHKQHDFTNKKRMVICCDGTWNSANARGSKATNVSRLAGAVSHKCCSGLPQIVYYHAGVGTEESKVANAIGGIFGVGVAHDIVETYRFICDNYFPGDEIVIIGFSRGAFTARSVAGMICALGFLNRAGLEQLPHIFHDYQTFQDWGNTTYNPNDHLMGFTLQNKERLERQKAWKERKEAGVQEGPGTVQGTPPDLAAELAMEKKQFYESMQKLVAGKKRFKKTMDLGKMSEEYRKKLFEHGMTLSRATSKKVDGVDQVEYVPEAGSVKAVGVWDTVGSLGMPKMPLYHDGREDQEIRFASLDVHPNVEYAFHALGLDEFRTAFNCTLWGKKDNNTTKLRQVWFPGTHCDVGGGFTDHSMATVSLAWMADQLTSVGVEFNKWEMSRLFHTVHPTQEIREWGMGRLHNPSGVTTYPDWIHTTLAAPYRLLTGKSTEYTTRTPGDYLNEGEVAGPLVAPNELVHPSARIRYQNGGPTMDDAGPWKCRALVERGWRLETRKQPETPIRETREASATAEFSSVTGSVTPYYVKPLVAAATGSKFVKGEQPREVDDLFTLPAVDNYWVWVKEVDGKMQILPEEHIGMWERMFMKINKSLLISETKNKEMAAQTPVETSWSVKGFVSGLFGGKGKPEKPIISHNYPDMCSWQKGDPPRDIIEPPRADE